MYTVEEGLRKLCAKVFELFSEADPARFPEFGKFRPFIYQLQYPGTDYLGVMQISYSDEDRAERFFSVGVRHMASDMLISNFLFSGTKQEILDWMKTDEALSEVVSTIMTLKPDLESRLDD